MESGMQDDWALLVHKIIDYAAKVHGDQQVISYSVEEPGRIITSTYREIRDRAALCAMALRRLGIQPGDRVASLAWNTYRHIECWYGVPGIGAVLHTLNPRLFDKELDYIINHAQDRIIIADISFVDMLERLLPNLPTVEYVIYLTDAAQMPPRRAGSSYKAQILCYEDLLAAERPELPTFAWTECVETQACGLCYTSGTTGNPKGVLYSHRSNFMLLLSACIPDALDIKSNSSFLVLVPMFHANAWGITFAGPFVGAKLVLPGPQLDGRSIHSMMETHGVTHTAGVPTLWAGLIDHLESTGGTLSSLEMMVVGGSPLPRHMLEYFEEKFNVEVRHMWGMTEISPFGTLGKLKGSLAAKNLGKEANIGYKLKQGWPLVFVDMRIVDDAGKELPRDGKTFGHLQVRGPHTLKRYFRAEQLAVDGDGWFDTGDVATLDSEGYMQITDRAKDVIKSGGEWISSIEIENLAAGHPKVSEAAVIGIDDEKWGERPLLVIVRKDNGVGSSTSSTDSSTLLSRDEMLQYLDGKIVRWWMPDDVVFVESIPHTATGKISKLQLREQFKEYKAKPRAKL